MHILLTRISNTEHRFEIERADGSRESAVLNTRSFLVHDLVHFAVESELQETQAFYGLLASGRPLAEINDRENPPAEAALMRIEALVGPLQSHCQGRGNRAALLSYFEQGDTPVEAAFIDAVSERMRQLLGHWRGTPFPESMRLAWRVPPLPPR